MNISGKRFIEMTAAEQDAVIKAQSPHRSRDGCWGGWGEPEWFRGERFGYCKGDVIERKMEAGLWRWTRVWVEANACWRSIEDEDRKQLPDPARPAN